MILTFSSESLAQAEADRIHSWMCANVEGYSAGASQWDIPKQAEDGTWSISSSPVLDAATPRSVTMRQARLALLGAGLLSQVDAAIASLPNPNKEAAQIEWEYSSDVQRDKALVQSFKTILGLNEADLDRLFLAASEL